MEGRNQLLTQELFPEKGAFHQVWEGGEGRDRAIVL